MSRISNHHPIAIGTAIVAAVLIVQSTAHAATLAVSPNAALVSGAGRAIGASWPDSGPYKVSFICDVPGCANYTASSTTSTSLTRYVSVTTCTGYIANSTTHVTDLPDGSSASGVTQTTWSKGKIC